MEQIEAVTFDFYETLIHSRDGKGRGDLYQDYLTAQGLHSAPWDHEVLYEVFDYYAGAYNPKLSADDKMRFWEQFTRRLFELTGVTGEAAHDLEKHAGVIRDIFGPQHFQLYPEVPHVLDKLHGRGLRLGVISNWQKGLAHFCDELGILTRLEVVISSAEVGVEKPDPTIFQEASRRLRVAPKVILHVGDQLADDVNGAKNAGYRSVWLNREGERSEECAISSLMEIEELIE